MTARPMLYPTERQPKGRRKPTPGWWGRGQELRYSGLGYRRIWRQLVTEGWEIGETAVRNAVERQDWHIAPEERTRRAEAERQRILSCAPGEAFGKKELAAEALWRAATKRCDQCGGVAAGETCPQGHGYVLPSGRTPLTSEVNTLRFT